MNVSKNNQEESHHDIKKEINEKNNVHEERDKVHQLISNKVKSYTSDFEELLINSLSDDIAEHSEKEFESKKEQRDMLKRDNYLLGFLVGFLIVSMMFFVFLASYKYNQMSNDIEILKESVSQTKLDKISLMKDVSSLKIMNKKLQDSIVEKGLMGMFQGAEKFNQDISHWDVSNVKNMDYMFKNAKSFNQDLSNWCVEQIKEKPIEFDVGSGFEGLEERHPNWGEPCNKQ